jgi:hypothetical protein
MFEDDTKNPFMPGDTLPKPEPGDVLYLRDMEINKGITRRVQVLWTHDSLAESWDPVGEHAWTQRDLNDAVGFKGRWYAIVSSLEDDGEDWSIASYEALAYVTAKQ